MEKNKTNQTPKQENKNKVVLSEEDIKGENKEETTSNVSENDVELKQEENKEKSLKVSKSEGKKRGKRSMELMPEPNDGRVVDREVPVFSNSLLPDHQLSLAEFKGRIAVLPADQVVPEFVKLFKAGLLLS